MGEIVGQQMWLVANTGCTRRQRKTKRKRALSKARLDKLTSESRAELSGFYMVRAVSVM